MNEIINEILDCTTEDELMFDIENTDIDFLADVARDVVFHGTVPTRDIREALIRFAQMSLEAAEGEN